MELTALSNTSLECIQECQLLLNSNSDLDRIVVKLDSFLLAVESAQAAGIRVPWGPQVINKLETAILFMIEAQENTDQCSVGRPTIQIPISGLELLLSMKFKVTEIAKMYGVSRHTISRRLSDRGLSVSQSYSVITDEELHQRIQVILISFPNTGYKRMKGFLLNSGIKVIDQRVREAMRIVDPEGVYRRTMSNRAIVRRVYYVSYFNQLWHLDTNMKLIRWNIVIRSCIDGKTRLVLYLNASGDNTAETSALAFIKATTIYGVPYRTRSDKGGENVLIARFMLEQRGLGRGSHICGRSVHNQRIERYWRDVFYGYSGAIYNVLASLEEDGKLDIDNPKHLFILHFVFLPRINQNLEMFRNAWNCHPLSSESNKTPMQLMVLTMPPRDHDLELNPEDLEDINFVCNSFEDLQFMDSEQETITNPSTPHNVLSASEFQNLNQIEVLRESASLGYDIFVEAISVLDCAY